MNSLRLLPVSTASLLLGTLLFLPASLAGSLAGSLAHPSNPPHPRLAQAQPQQMPVLGVVKSRENASQWQAITERLDASGLAYQVIDWRDVQRSADFGDVTVLFLPNLATISSDQLLGLQAWLNRGGGLIVSGAVGSQSSAGVQNALRSLLGAYWATDLSQPQSILPLQLASQRWVRQVEADNMAGSTTGSITGGVLVPTSLASQPVAVWNQAETAQSGVSNSAAVVVTQKTTFLGWRWGDASASLSEFDQSWLRAAVSRFGNLSPLLAAPVSRPVRATAPAPVAVSPAPTRPRPAQPAPAASQPPAQPPVQPPAQPPVDITQLLRQPQASAPSIPSAQPSVSRDPAEQMTPADLDLEHSPRITLYEAGLMQQELENLIGRYESAVILASSRDGLQAERHSGSSAIRPISTSASNNASNSASSRTEAALNDAVLTEARQGYSSLAAALRQHDYSQARQQWLATRQLLWNNFPLDRPLSQPEVRAIWLDRGTIVQAGSRQGLAQLFDRLAAAGINTIFFETVNAGYPIYPSQVAPAQNPLTQGWDPLAAAVDLAHQRQMELHAWVWAFAAGNQAHNAILQKPASYPGPVLAAHPDWANYDNRGSMIPPGQTKPFLDPANPAVRQYLLNLYTEIVSRYDVDGLQLDYIRYPFQDPRAGCHTYGYGSAARQQFQQQTGVDPISLSPTNPAQRQLWQQWTEFRIEQISSFVAETSEQLHQIKPDLILSTAVFALPERRRLNEIQQNWERWAQQGDVDMIVLMSYAGDTNSLQRLTNPWLAADANLGSALVLPGIRLLNLSDATVLDQVQALRDSPSGGFALFAAENLDGKLQQIFQQIQGSSAEPIPYRDPFAAAASRYGLLMQQWSWLMAQGELQLRDSQMQSWQTKTTELDQALKALAESPSEANLRQATTLLNSFQSQFKTWIELPTLSADYRIRTWQNQLAIVDKLLSYGNQTVLARQLESQTTGR